MTESERLLAKKIIGGLDILTSNPLFSFNTLVDKDVGLVLYVLKEFRNDTIFNLELADSLSIEELIGRIYRRKDKNPLLVIAKENLSEDKIKLLNDAYLEFITERPNTILSYSLTTEIPNVINSFINNGQDLNPHILYYTDGERALLEGKTFNFDKEVPLVSIDDILKQRDINRGKNFTQFYLKFVEEADPFNQLLSKTFYFASTGVNLDENNDNFRLDLSPKIYDIITRGNYINLFDMYQRDIIGGYNTNE